MEPPRAAGARVEPEDTVFLFLHVLVGVAEHHRVHTGQVRRDLLSVVDHEKGHAAQGNGEIVRDGLRPVLVVVAPDDVQRRILPQLIHDALPVDISAMEDGVGGL